MDNKAVSPDSSTQLTERSKKFKKRKHKNRSKRKKKKFNSSGSSQDVESDSSRSGNKRVRNSSEDIKHLREFVNDRKELHAQLFSIISKREVKGMMPDILKKLSFREVRKLCSEQLQLLSNRQIESIIAGKGIAPSEDESDEERESPDEKETSQQQIDMKEQKRKQNEGDDTKDKKVKKRKEEEKKENDIIIFQEMITIPKQEEIDELVEGSSVTQEQTMANSIQSRSGEATIDDEAELKELEFRARALQSLVRARELQMKVHQDF